METKTYFANSVQAAMETARRELGPDAMLVTSRPAPEAMRAFGRLEVAFAWEAGAVQPAEGAGAPFGRKLRAPEAWPRRGESGLEDIRQEISALRAAIGRKDAEPAAGAETDRPGSVDGAVRALTATGMEEETARLIVAAGASGAPAGESRDGSDILRELEARIPAAPFAIPQADECRTLALLGAPGRGKTATLVKIAVRYGLANRIPTRIFTAGAHGVGAAEQMSRYAAILGVPFQALESWESLNLALQGDRWKGFVLIDTPGVALSDRQEMEAMSKFLATRRDIEKHLVIRSEARSADMQDVVLRFASVQPSRLLFTGVDEVAGLGAAVETMIRSGLATTFFGTGPRIPDDLEEVNVPRLARSLWRANELAARAA